MGSAPATAATLISPTGNLGANNPPTYTWSAVTDATEYRVYIRDNTNGVTIHNQLHSTAEVGCDVATTCSLAPFTTPLATGKYTWRVKAKNTAGDGPWTSYKSFKAGSAPATAATLISPTGNLGANNPPTYTWSAVTDATEYRVYIRDNTNGVTIHNQLHSTAEVGCDVATTCSLAPFTTPLATGKYTWRVRAENAAGDGPWTSYKSFTAGSAPTSAATLTSPTGNLGANNPPTYIWSAVADATKYQVYIRNITNGVTIHNQLHSAAVAGCDVATTCSLAPFTTPLATGNYRWRVRANNAVGYGPWTSNMSFNN